jgi:hypothetical protein
VLLTNPLDVIRTRLQVNSGNSSTTTAAAATATSSSATSSRGAAAAASSTVNTETMWSEAKALWATDGAKALLRGIGPRYVQHNMHWYNINY